MYVAQTAVVRLLLTGLLIYFAVWGESKSAMTVLLVLMALAIELHTVLWRKRGDS
jgi:hypothetical protein